MDRPNLILTFSFKDDTQDATLKLYNENFVFEYGISDRKDLQDANSLQSIFSIYGEEGIKAAQNFLFSNYSSISKIENLKKITVEIFRSNYEEPQIFLFDGNVSNNLIFNYINNQDRDDSFVIIFNFIPTIN